MSQRLFVGSLSFDTEDTDLQQLFSKYGTCASARVIRDRVTGRSRGFAFVEMETPEDAQRAIAGTNGNELHGRAISVSEARERTQGAPRRGPFPPRGLDHSFDAPPPSFRKNKGSRRGVRGRKRSL